MRTTIDLEDGLARRVKKLAVDKNTSMKALIEDGLRLVLIKNQAVYQSPEQKLKGLGKKAWDGIDPDHYVREQRENWS
ncbi:MAG TPA: hypothetical protein PJ991_08600 [Kiritimatiellia bacterium]|nr:hypothetical protein [Kiritimatiellia bacterium]